MVMAIHFLEEGLPQRRLDPRRVLKLCIGTCRSLSSQDAHQYYPGTCALLVVNVGLFYLVH